MIIQKQFLRVVIMTIALVVSVWCVRTLPEIAARSPGTRDSVSDYLFPCIVAVGDA